MSPSVTLHHVFRESFSLRLGRTAPPVPPFQCWSSKQLCEALHICAGVPLPVFMHGPPAHYQLRHLLVSTEIFVGKLKDELIKYSSR